MHSELGNWPLTKISSELIDKLEQHAKSGAPMKRAAHLVGVPPGILRRWLSIGEERWTEDGDTAEPCAELYARCSKAAAVYASRLQGDLTSAGAGKDSSPGAAGWLLERVERDEFGATSKLEISGPEGVPIAIEGKAVVGLADVVALARELGQGHLFGLDGGDAERAIPAAREVLPDPPELVEAASSLPDVPGS